MRLRPELRVPLALGAIIALSVALLFLSATALAERGVPSPITNPADFRAFVCGAQALESKHDPYLTEPLRTCEHADTAAFGLQMFDGLVLPAPLAPYALIAFAPFVAVPFPIASDLWFVLTLAAVGASVVATVRLTRLPLALVAPALIGSDAFVSVALGQIVPFVVLAICLAALAVRAQRFALAGTVIALATVEPHLALPACAALFVFERRARRSLAACALLALAVSLALAGPATCLEYVRDVLPLHALSQIDDLHLQFSLTAVLYAFGAGARASLALGTLSYIAMALAGIRVAGLLARRFEDGAFLVLLPPAFALLGGAFVHLAQMAVAIPALGLVISYTRARSAARYAAYAGLIALAIPWASLADGPALAPLLWPHSIAARHVNLPASDDAAIAERSEIDFIHAGGYGSDNGPPLVAISLKVPTWFGLIALVGLSTALLRRPKAASGRLPLVRPAA